MLQKDQQLVVSVELLVFEFVVLVAAGIMRVVVLLIAIQDVKSQMRKMLSNLALK